MADFLRDLSLDRANRIFLHPRHQEMPRLLADLICDLRQCVTPADFFQYQQELLGKVLDVQAHRLRCRGVVRRLEKGRPLPADAPELRSAYTVHELVTWQLEVDVCNRIDRQLRSIADGLAWRVFSYDRAVITALSRNQSPGPMAGKKGLEAERAFLTDWWRNEQEFVLLHDLTTCLRIGDATSFMIVGNQFEAYLHEIKSDDGRKRPTQLRRQRMAEEALRSGGLLPGLPGYVVQLDIRYRTHLDRLSTAFDLAATRGVQGLRIPGGRSLVAVDLVRGYELWTENVFIHRTAIEHLQATKRARILGADHLVHVRSDDLVARSPTMPPWAIYPLAPVVCAKLTTDYAMYIVTMSNEAILDALDKVGVRAEWTLDHDLASVGQDHVILRAWNDLRVIEMRWAELERRLLLEMCDLDVWARSLRSLLNSRRTGRHPWQFFADESAVWA
jgi:hypothetical protein